MRPVLYLTRRMLEVPPIASSDAMIRTWQSAADISHWLGIHRACFLAPHPEARQWEEADLRRELLSKPGWRPEWTWFALIDEAPEPIGMISLLMRPNDPPLRVHLHWLAIAPDWRRRGIARQLLFTAERAAWEAGFRELALETLAAWKDAAAFYEASGYREESMNSGAAGLR